MLTEEELEYRKLQEKKRLLMGKLEEAEEAVRRKEQRFKALQEEVRALQERCRGGMEGKEGEEGLPDAPDGGLTDVEKIRAVLERIAEDGSLIRAKYSTKLAERYYKIERGVFEGYAGSLLHMETGTFLDICVREGLLKTDNGKAVYTSGRQRVYYLDKDVADGLRGKKLLE